MKVIAKFEESNKNIVDDTEPCEWPLNVYLIDRSMGGD